MICCWIDTLNLESGETEIGSIEFTIALLRVEQCIIARVVYSTPYKISVDRSTSSLRILTCVA